MTSMERALYALKFDLEFQSKRANEFQLFFNKIMNSRFPGDFIPTRTWGKEGDCKCDGYILSTGCFFQVYAPDELEKSVTIKKMTEDFLGAIEHWGDKIKTWVFVHNSRTGVPPFVLDQLLEFKKEHPEIGYTHLGKDEIKDIFFQISDAKIEEILGPVPTYADVNGLTMESIRQTLLGIESLNCNTENDAPINPVSERKLQANGLSQDSKQLFELGMMKSNLVEKFFKQWHDPNCESYTAHEISSIYNAAKSDSLNPNEVFQRIFMTINESDTSDTKRMVSTLAVMAYFFQTCDIFEQPREEEGI